MLANLKEFMEKLGYSQDILEHDLDLLKIITIGKNRARMKEGVRVLIDAISTWPKGNHIIYFVHVCPTQGKQHFPSHKWGSE